MVDAIILAGGFGTRLKEVVPHLPKPLAPINGVPFLDLLLNHIEQSGVVKKVVLAIGYKAEAIVQHYRGRSKRILIEFSIEETPLGTGGAILKALGKIDSSPVFIFNGDTFFSCDLSAMARAYTSSLMMAYTHVADVSRYGTIQLGEQNQIVAFEEKKNRCEAGYINAGVYLFDRKIFARPLPNAFSLEQELLPKLLEEGITGFYADDTFIDIGTKDSFSLAQRLLQPLTEKK